MMKYFVLVSFFFVVSSAFPFVDKWQKVEHWPKRVRRDEVAITKNTKYGINDGVPYVQHQVNLANSGDHKLDANAFVSKDFHHNRPAIAKGSLNYAHKPSGGGIALSGSNQRGGATNVGAAGVWNVYRKGGFGVDLQGGYSRSFGGPFGNGPPVYGVEIRGGYAFPIRG